MTGATRTKDYNSNEASRRHWVLSRTLPEIRTRDGRTLDPDDDSFLWSVSREQDRALLRIVKDIPLSPQVVNYRDINGVVSVIRFNNVIFLIKL